MTDWTARIDALLAEKMPDRSWDIAEAKARHYKRRLALAAERLREPHHDNCRSWGIDYVGDGDAVPGDCTCGKDADLLRILEGK